MVTLFIDKPNFLITWQVIDSILINPYIHGLLNKITVDNLINVI